MRAFELDVHADPEGGLYGQAAGLRLAGAPGWLSDERYQRPGFKVSGRDGGGAWSLSLLGGSNTSALRAGLQL